MKGGQEVGGIRASPCAVKRNSNYILDICPLGEERRGGEEEVNDS